jgi:hypothetical protein
MIQLMYRAGMRRCDQNDMMMANSDTGAVKIADSSRKTM